jgi:hypothetical protein
LSLKSLHALHIPQIPLSLFAIDISCGAPIKELVGRNGEAGKVLKCAELGKTGKNGIRGSHFPYGSTGMASLGGGRFAFSKDGKNENGFYTYIEEYTLSENNPDIFIKAIKELKHERLHHRSRNKI